MHIEVEKKKDSLFQNTTKYNELIDAVKNVGEKCSSLEEFNSIIMNEWNNIVDRCCIKSNVHIYRYHTVLKENPKYGEYIMFYMKSEIDEGKFNKEKNKLILEIEENEKKINNKMSDEGYLNDLRITDNMILAYKLALTETKSVLIQNPHYILDHMDKMKRKFLEYLIDILENKQMCGIQKKIMLDNEYTKYMSLMTGIEVLIPDELKNI